MLCSKCAASDCDCEVRAATAVTWVALFLRFVLPECRDYVTGTALYQPWIVAPAVYKV